METNVALEAIARQNVNLVGVPGELSLTAIWLSANLTYYLAYQQAAAQGVSIFVSFGDENAMSADNGNVAQHGIGVSGFTSTPYNVSVERAAV